MRRRALPVFTIAIFGFGIASAQEMTATGTLRHDGLVNAPVQQVWKALSTSEGLRSWMAPLVEIDLRVGGKMLSSYKADARLGDENTIENTILSFEPGRMISLKATKPPAGFPFPEAIKDMWSVIYLDPMGVNRTRVTVCGMGYTDTEEGRKLREFFDKGNAYTIEQLRKKFATPSDSGQTDPLPILHQLVGGEWTFEKKEGDGRVFRGRSMIEFGPDRKSLVARGWLGDAAGMYEHGATQIWRDPASNAIRFQSLDEQGAVAGGEIISIGDNAVSWDWNMVVPGGRRGHYRADMLFSGKDKYEFVLYEVKSDGTLPERVRVPYARVEKAPDVFHQMKPRQN